MRRLTIGTVAVGMVTPLLLFAGVGCIQAATVFIDFEQFNDGYNLHGVNLGGVTLTNPSGNVEIFANRFGVGRHSGTNSIASPAGLYSANPLVGRFDSPVSYVGLWGGDGGTRGTFQEVDSWELLAFDAQFGGNLVGRVGSGTWIGNPYRQLSISAPEIWRLEANWTGPYMGIGYDDLQFTPIPPPPPPPPPPPLPDSEPQPDPPPITPGPSNASFSSDSDQNVLNIDFGDLPLGGTASSRPFDLWNLASTGLTADLNLDDFAGSGDTGALDMSLAPFVGLAPNSSRSYSVGIDTSTVGEFDASFSLFVSDVTGTPQTPLTISITGSVVPEPSTFILAAVGLLSLLAWGWWRRKAG